MTSTSGQPRSAADVRHVAPSPQNEILANLPARELAEIMSHAEQVFIPLRQEIFEQGTALEQVYFPMNGMISLVVVLSDGTSIEAMTVGREGFVGLPLLNQVNTARYKGVCQVEGTFLVLDAGVFLSIIDSLGDLKRRLLRYSQFAGEVVAQSAACNSVHTVEQRCARWLLITADATGNTEFHITQEFLSQMLAVRRPGVTVAMRTLVKAGLVSGRYGHVKLLDPQGLKDVACECYETVRSKAAELLA
jgi:CRP-like cAMP-binding protein